MTGQDIIDQRRQERLSFETRIKQKAIEVYATFDPSERTCVRIGLFPRDKMEKAEADLLVEFKDDEYAKANVEDIGRILAVGIMDAANAGPDKMIA